jgi:hypothetical protein
MNNLPILSNYGKLFPLIIDSNFTNGTGTMNPTVYNDNGVLLCNIRNVNYILYHSEKKIFNHYYGPLQYLQPEKNKFLKTINYLCELDDEYNISNVNKIDTSKLDKPPIWEFVGLEDVRLVRWNSKLYITGVRRDTTEYGQGRMELSLIENYKEVERIRIPSTYDDSSYCEKNWMPILDRPFEYIKWSDPTEIVKIENGKTIITHLSDFQFTKSSNFRGGSQVIPINVKNRKFYFSIVHEVFFIPNPQQQKDGKYIHYILIWDENFSMLSVEGPFTFMNGDIEFCCGACLHNNQVLISFGFQDNSAFLLSIDQSIFFELVLKNAYAK